MAYGLKASSCHPLNCKFYNQVAELRKAKGLSVFQEKIIILEYYFRSSCRISYIVLAPVLQIFVVFCHINLRIANSHHVGYIQKFKGLAHMI